MTKSCEVGLCFSFFFISFYFFEVFLEFGYVHFMVCSYAREFYCSIYRLDCSQPSIFSHLSSIVEHGKRNRERTGRQCKTGGTPTRSFFTLAIHSSSMQYSLSYVMTLAHHKSYNNSYKVCHFVAISGNPAPPSHPCC